MMSGMRLTFAKLRRAVRVGWIAGRAVLMAERNMSVPGFAESRRRLLDSNLESWVATKDAAITAGDDGAFLMAEIQGLTGEMYALAELAGEGSGGFHYPLSYGQICDRDQLLRYAVWPAERPEYTIRFLGMTAVEWCSAPDEMLAVFRMKGTADLWRSQIAQGGGL
jgi:hypothetical protein